MTTRRNLYSVLFLIAVALFALAMVPGGAYAFNPQPEPPLKYMPPGQAANPTPIQAPAVPAQPPSAGPITRRTAPTPGQLPYRSKSIAPNLLAASAAGPTGKMQLPMTPALGNAGENAIIDNNKPGQGGAEGIVDDNKPGQGAAQTAK